MRSRSILSTVFIFAAIFAGSSCAGNVAGVETQASSHFAAISEADPELRSALTLIDKAPNSTTAYNNLAVLYIRRARITGDFSLYSKADKAAEQALELDATNETARKLRASLSLTFHRFAEALARGTALSREFPDDAFVHGILTDANVELGNYKQAVEAAQRMVDLRPNSLSYSRVAHMRSLYGDHNGAVEMYKLAARTADPADKEAQSWCLVGLGDEYFKNGAFEAAERTYDEALGLMPQYHLALAGKGRVRAALGDLDAGESILSDLVKRIPSPETAAQLGNIYELRGDDERARAQYDLVVMIETKLGSNNDQRRLAMLWADRNERTSEALTIAEKQNQLANDIYTNDLYAWCLYRDGRLAEARNAINNAMRLKKADARVLFHAGMIEKDLGNRAEAIRLLGMALKLNPAFDLIQARTAKSALSELKEAR